MIYGRAAISVPSTSVSVWSMSFSRGSRPSGFSSAPSSAMISFSRSASNTLSPPTANRARPAAAELPLHLAEFAGLLDAAQRRDDGIEQVQQDQHAILIEMQLAVAGLVALTAIVVQPLQQRRELVEVLQAGDIGFLEFPFLGHAPHYASRPTRCKFMHFP